MPEDERGGKVGEFPIEIELEPRLLVLLLLFAANYFIEECWGLYVGIVCHLLFEMVDEMRHRYFFVSWAFVKKYRGHHLSTVEIN